MVFWMKRLKALLDLDWYCKIGYAISMNMRSLCDNLYDPEYNLRRLNHNIM